MQDTNKSPNKDNPSGTLLNVFNIGASGGEQTHTLTENEMPSHNHIPDKLFTWLSYVMGSSTNGVASFAHHVGEVAVNATRATSQTGGGQPHNNIPPYYALAYIIKTVWSSLCEQSNRYAQINTFYTITL